MTHILPPSTFTTSAFGLHLTPPYIDTPEKVIGALGGDLYIPPKEHRQDVFVSDTAGVGVRGSSGKESNGGSIVPRLFMAQGEGRTGERIESIFHDAHELVIADITQLGELSQVTKDIIMEAAWLDGGGVVSYPAYDWIGIDGYRIDDPGKARLSLADCIKAIREVFHIALEEGALHTARLAVGVLEVLGANVQGERQTLDKTVSSVDQNIITRLTNEPETIEAFLYNEPRRVLPVIEALERRGESSALANIASIGFTGIADMAMNLKDDFGIQPYLDIHRRLYAFIHSITALARLALQDDPQVAKEMGERIGGNLSISLGLTRGSPLSPIKLVRTVASMRYHRAEEMLDGARRARADGVDFAETLREVSRQLDKEEGDYLRYLYENGQTNMSTWIQRFLKNEDNTLIGFMVYTIYAVTGYLRWLEYRKAGQSDKAIAVIDVFEDVFQGVRTIIPEAGIARRPWTRFSEALLESLEWLMVKNTEGAASHFKNLERFLKGLEGSLSLLGFHPPTY